MDKSINEFIWKHSAREQLILVVLTLAYLPTLYIMLELPKTIINKVLSSDGNHDFFNLTLDAESLLVVLIGIYLGLYLVNSFIKLIINVRKGILGERLVRRLRYSLVDRLLRFPIQRFRVVSQGETIAQLNSEAENLAGYMSESVVLPLFQGGTMLTVLIFMFVQSFWLGLAAVALIPLQVFIIPRMQRHVNSLNQERVRQVRSFSEYIGETVSGAQAIRVHGVQRYVLSGFSLQLGRLFDIRLRIYKKKYWIKLINNFINQLTPILFYLIGGLLVLRGHLTIGALIAAIAGHKDMVSPWKELLKYYQLQQDAKIKYQQLTEQFEVDEADESDYYVDVPAREQAPLFPLKMKNVVTEEDGNRILSKFNFELDVGEHVAIVEPDADKRLHIAELILSLRSPMYGSTWLGDQQIKDIPGSIKSRRLAYQPSSPPIFNISVYENILLPLKHVPTATEDKNNSAEAKLTGNSSDLFDAEWIDYDGYQFENQDALDSWYLQSMEAAEADRSVVRKGLFQYLVGESQLAQAGILTESRPLVIEALHDSEISVQSFDEREWCYGLSIAENLAFGKMIDSKSSPGELIYTPSIGDVLSANGFDRIVEHIGEQIAKMISQGLSSEKTRDNTMIAFNLHSDEQADSILQNAFSISQKSSGKYNESDREFLLLLFLNLVLDNHDDIGLPGSVISRIMFIRDEIDSLLDENQRASLQRFEYSEYHPGLSVLENLLFGLLPRDIDDESLVQVLDIVSQVITQAGFSRDIMLLTLKNAEAGISGSRLSSTSRQNLPLARVLVKRPELIVFNEGLNAFDENVQFRIKDNIRTLLPDTSILWLVGELEGRSRFDRVIDTTN